MRYKRAILAGLCGTALARGLRSGFDDLRVTSRAAEEAARTAPSPFLRTIPVRTLGALLQGREIDIRLTVRAHRDGQLPLTEALAFLTLLTAANPGIVLEIGTYFGNTTKAMAMNLPHATIHTVDLPPDFTPSSTNEPLAKDDFHLIRQRRVGEAFLNTEYQSRIVQHFGDTATWNFQEAAGATFFFIDGSHTYAYCKNDSEKCFELCGGRGVFVWHDCDDGHPGVLEFIDEWRKLGRDIVRVDKTPLCYWSSL